MTHLRWVHVLAPLLLAACTRTPSAIEAEPRAPRAEPPNAQPAPADKESSWGPLLRSIGAGYTQYTKADEHLFFAPELCAAPKQGPRLPISMPPAAPHGGKVYFVYAKDVPAYTRVEGAKAGGARGVPGDGAASQVIVKETWAAREGGTKGEKGPLFIMAKVAEKRGTDDGWIFGMVSADGKDVLQAGVIESCSNCHKNAKHDHQFGPPGLASKI